MRSCCCCCFSCCSQSDCAAHYRHARKGHYHSCYYCHSTKESTWHLDSKLFVVVVVAVVALLLQPVTAASVGRPHIDSGHAPFQAWALSV